MTVRELITMLLTQDMNAQVIMSTHDINGDYYIPANDVVHGRYVPLTSGGAPTGEGDFYPAGTYNAHSGVGVTAVIVTSTDD